MDRFVLSMQVKGCERILVLHKTAGDMLEHMFIIDSITSVGSLGKMGWFFVLATGPYTEQTEKICCDVCDASIYESFVLTSNEESMPVSRSFCV